MIGLLYGNKASLFKLISIWDVYLISGIALYFAGTLHRLAEKEKHAEITFKFMGLQAALLSLFIHTFELGEYKVENVVPVIYIFSGILLLAILSSEKLRSRLTGFQVDSSMASISFLMAGVTLTTVYSPLSEKTYVGFFNIIFLGLLVMLLYAGYSTENIVIINTAMFWFIPLIFARYFDFFWELLPRSLFFIVGGLALLAISMGL